MSTAPIPVFAGPSLWGHERRLEGFTWRPPAQAGDLIALLHDPPAKLCLIDGLFDSCAAPWHKELLLLMAAGTRVFGAASMGALRAAELERFGMTGVGNIFAAYRDGRLTGDDEVALVHATERWRWKPLTVPMVEVRATLVAARRAGLLSPEQAKLVRQSVHDIHYDMRDWPTIREICVAIRLLTKAEAEALEALHVPLKRLDAVRCLELALSGDEARPTPPPPLTCFIRELASQRGMSPTLPPVPFQPDRTAALPNHAGTGDAT